MVPYRDSNILLRPLGNFLYTLKHFNRAYELRFENFIALKALTIGIPSPIWSKFCKYFSPSSMALKAPTVIVDYAV